jgi:GAF domain-containing protein
LASSRDSALLTKTVKMLHDHCAGWNWVGIYLLVGQTLILGPFEGKPTEHKRIPVGVGVCGSAVQGERNIIVDDVANSANYLACSVETRSELVVLIRGNNGVIAQFDIDSDQTGAFTERDEQFLETLASIVAEQCWQECLALSQKLDQ